MDPSFKPPLTHSKKLHIKDDLNSRSNNSALSKTLLFLTSQIVQDKHKGATLQAFFLFFPAKCPCQLSNVVLTNECSIYAIPNKEKTKLP